MEDQEADVAYRELRDKLEINVLRIDQELVELPQLVQQAAELASVASSNEHVAKHALDVTVAEASAGLRVPALGMKARSETQIASEIPLDDDVQRARSYYDNTREISSRYTSLHYSMREKSKLVMKVCEMINGGFLTPSSFARRLEQGRTRERESPQNDQ
jgi:hypothetical protein